MFDVSASRDRHQNLFGKHETQCSERLLKHHFDAIKVLCPAPDRHKHIHSHIATSTDDDDDDNSCCSAIYIPYSRKSSSFFDHWSVQTQLFTQIL